MVPSGVVLLAALHRGAAVDAAGNALGAEFDLGVAGAFTGLKVVVIHQYRGEGFDFSHPRAAMQVPTHEQGGCALTRCRL